MADHGPERTANPPPLTVAAWLVGVQGLVLVVLALVELVNVDGERVSVAVSVSAFFAIYGVLLVVCAVALSRRSGWARGPALISQLIQLGIAWNLRDVALLAVLLAVAALIALAGMLSPASIEALVPRADEEPGAR